MARETPRHSPEHGTHLAGKLLTEFNLESDYEKHDDEIGRAVRSVVGTDSIHVAGVARHSGRDRSILDRGGRFLTL